MAEQKSLRERILGAVDEQELEGLLAVGDTYKDASAHTRGRWRSAARKRRAFLKGAK